MASDYRWLRQCGAARPTGSGWLPVLLVLIGPWMLQSSSAQSLRSPELRMQYHRAERAWRTGASLHEAKARLDRVIAALPDDGEAHLLRARVLSDLGRPAEALVDARNAVRLLPEHGEAWLIRANAARQAGSVDESLDALARAAEWAPDRADFHVRLSWTAQSLDRLGEAEAYARIALVQDPGSAEAYVRLAHVFLAQERTDDAVLLLARGLDEDVLGRRVFDIDPLLGTLAGRPALRRRLQR